jgi:hypothetical protein
MTMRHLIQDSRNALGAKRRRSDGKGRLSP